MKVATHSQSWNYSDYFEQSAIVSMEIHFQIKVDAQSLIEMINNPDLMPSAPGN